MTGITSETSKYSACIENLHLYLQFLYIDHSTLLQSYPLIQLLIL